MGRSWFRLSASKPLTFAAKSCGRASPDEPSFMVRILRASHLFHSCSSWASRTASGSDDEDAEPKRGRPVIRERVSRQCGNCSASEAERMGDVVLGGERGGDEEDEGSMVEKTGPGWWSLVRTRAQLLIMELAYSNRN